MRKVSILAAGSSLIFALACGGSQASPDSPEDAESEGPMEEAGQEIDEAAEDVEEGAEEAVDETGDALGEAGDEIDEETEDVE